MNPGEWKITIEGVNVSATAAAVQPDRSVWRVRATHLPSGMTASCRGDDLLFEIAFACQAALRAATNVRVNVAPREDYRPLGDEFHRFKCSSVFGLNREHNFVGGQCLRCHAKDATTG
jgi:hypothetical protein